MRCLVKAIAMFGLGHYIYNGEDFPRKEDDLEQEEQAQVPNDDDKAKDFAESIKQKLKQATTEKQAMHVFDNDPDQRQWLEQQYPTLYAELGQLCMDKLDQIKNGE
jgi:streptogramin lyase